MSSQLSYRLHGREQRPKTLRKHYRDELDTGQVKDLGQRAESLFRKAVGDGPQSVFCARPYGQFRGTTQADGLKSTTISDQTFPPFDACWYTC